LSISPSNKFLSIKNNVLYDDEITKLYYMMPTFSENEFQIPDSVEEIAGYAFWGNTSLINVSLSSNMYTIPEFAFSNCKNLKQVLIPLSVRKIDSKAFEDCINLTSVKCSESINYIAENAFDGCPNVTLNASIGTYAYDFGQKLLKDKIDEIEYEDVSDYKVVTSTTEKSIVSSLDGEQTEVVEGHPDHNDISENGENYSEGDNSDNENEAAGNANSENTNNAGIYSTPDVTINNAAKYYNGVINGADVVSYSYYNAQDYNDDNTLGSGSVVGGRALVFIDNSNARVRGYNTDTNNAHETNGNTLNTSNSEAEAIASAGDIDLNPESKSMDFPKFTIVGNNIASQSFYNDKSLKEFDIPENITRIGDFAFSRSGLNNIVIPEGVTDLGYGAFYHCEDLESLKLPSTIEHIGAYAFDKTALVSNSLDSFVVSGDVLIAYKGNESVVTIPEGVRLIADGCFMDRNGITAVNFPDSLKIIGEDAFYGCSNLRTINRGDNIEIIGANAFYGTSLSNVTIPSSVKTIGTGAFNLNNGTDTVTFKGGELPKLTQGYDSKRLSNDKDRTYAFGNIKNAVIQGMVNEINNTVLEPGVYGFKGIVKNEGGTVILDSSNGINTKKDGKVTVNINSAYIDENSAYADVLGDDGSFILNITDSQNAKERIINAYSELYGGKKPISILGLDVSLLDSSGTLYITKLGKQEVKVSLSIPDEYYTNALHVVCLDEDGQLENVNYVLSEENNTITITCTHFSPYALYLSENNAIVKDGTRIKDTTPDTGDISIHPKFFLALGLAALGLMIILLSYKKRA